MGTTNKSKPKTDSKSKSSVVKPVQKVETRIDKINAVIERLKAILKEKNDKYGDAAFENPLFTTIPIETAIAVRLGDKVKRLQTLIFRSDCEKETNDALLDLAGYAILWLSIREG